MIDDPDNEDLDNRRIDADVDNDLEQQRVARRQTKIEREQAEEDKHWRQQLASKVGRRALYKMFAQGKLWETPFAVGPNGFPQPDATWYQAGERELVRRIHDKLQILDHASIYLMMCENDPRFKHAPLPQVLTHAA